MSGRYTMTRVPGAVRPGASYPSKVSPAGKPVATTVPATNRQAATLESDGTVTFPPGVGPGVQALRVSKREWLQLSPGPFVACLAQSHLAKGTCDAQCSVPCTASPDDCFIVWESWGQVKGACCNWRCSHYNPDGFDR